MDFDVRVGFGFGWSSPSIHHLTITTRNERDFRQLGVQVLDPFKTLR
ncbi:MAG: hypothetical protein LAO18_21665 [Acidobacteriia bacterium]|jgi:hypothetical protein|nr:hypothetical protein [Terriglobia bacterium]